MKPAGTKTSRISGFSHPSPAGGSESAEERAKKATAIPPTAALAATTISAAAVVATKTAIVLSCLGKAASLLLSDSNASVSEAWTA